MWVSKYAQITNLIRRLLALICIGMYIGFIPVVNAQSVPLMINYQGKIDNQGTPFTGTGYFKFSFVDDPVSPTINYWVNDGSAPVAGGEPTDYVITSMNFGFFSMQLGDASLTNMTNIPAGTFDQSTVYLRTWFSTDGSTFEQLSPDRQLVSVPYAFHAETAEAIVGTDVITTTEITDGTVTNADISTAANIDASKINTSGASNLVSRIVAGSGVTVTNSGVGDVTISVSGGGGGSTSDVVCTNCVDSSDITDGTVSTADLAFDPATQTELDGHKASADHDSRYYTQTQLNSVGTINNAGNPVDWSQLKNVPAGFADGTDDGGGGAATDVTCTDCVDSSDITDGTIANADISSSAAIAASKIADGPGSGLDADTVDGVQASALMLKAGDTMTGALTMNNSTGADALIAESGINRNSISSETFNIQNAGGGSMELQVDGNKVFHAGNDGSGSGLDADTLDGQSAASFASSSHNHAGEDITSGTVADARVASTLTRDTEVFGIVTANDGAASGLDADLLDGNHASAFATASHNHSGGDITSGTVADARIASTLTRDTEVFGIVTANDGASSGLDADLLDGLNSSALARSGSNSDITSITRATGGSFDINIGGNAGDDFIVDTDKLVVEGDTGEVGIGTTDPTSKLTIVSGSTSPLRLESSTETMITLKGGVNSNSAGILFRNSSDSLNYSLVANSSGNMLQFNSNQSAGRAFQFGDNITSVNFVDSRVQVGIGTNSPSTALETLRDDATDNAVVDIVTINKTTSGIPAAGIGAGLVFNVEDAGGSEEQASIDVSLSTVTDASEDADIIFNLNKSGAITEIARFDGSAGSLQLGTDGIDGKLVIYGDEATTDQKVTIVPHADMTMDYTLTLPADDGTNGQILTTDGSGALTWTTNSSSIVYENISDPGANNTLDFTTYTNTWTSTSTTNDFYTITADSLTTGSLGLFSSNSANTSARNLIEIVNDNAAATGAVPLMIRNDSTGDDVKIVNTDAGAVGSKLVLHHDSVSPAVSDAVATIEFVGEDSTSAATDYARIQGVINDPTDTTEDGELVFSSMQGGTLTEAMRIGVNGQVGIGTNSPADPLHVVSAVAGTTATIEQTANDDAALRLKTPSSNFVIESKESANRLSIWDTNASATRFSVLGDGTIGIGTTTTSGQLDIVSSSTSTTAATERGFELTTTDTGVVSVGTDTTLGLDLNVTRTGASGGTINTTGLDLDVTGDAGGVSTAIGLDVNVSGADTNYAALLNGGNVGIGTSSPSARLEVSHVGGAGLVNPAELRLANTTDQGSAQFYFQETNNYGFKIRYHSSSDGASNGLEFFGVESGVDKGVAMRIERNNGWIGIGDSTPDHLLDVAGNIGLSASSYINFGDADGTSGYGFRDNSGTIEVKNSGGAWAPIDGALFNVVEDTTPQLGGNLDVNGNNLTSTAGLDISIGSNVGNDFTVDTNKFAVEGDTGNVGIGTSTPESHLTIADAVSGGVVELRIENTIAQNSSQIVFEEGGQGDNFAIKYNTDGGLGNGLEFKGVGSVLMRIERDSGKVGIGDSSPASLFTVGSSDAFQVNSSGAIASVKGLSGATGAYDLGGATSLEIPNSTTPSLTADGQIALDTDADQIKIQAGKGAGGIPVNTDVALPLIQQKDITLLEPDQMQLLSDAIPFITVDTQNYPNGITITGIRLATSAASTLAVNVEEWTAPEDGGTAATISAIATSGTTESTVTTMTGDAVVASGSYVFLDLDTTDVDWAKMTIWYYVN